MLNNYKKIKMTGKEYIESLLNSPDDDQLNAQKVEKNTVNSYNQVSIELIKNRNELQNTMPNNNVLQPIQANVKTANKKSKPSKSKVKKSDNEHTNRISRNNIQLNTESKLSECIRPHRLKWREAMRNIHFQGEILKKIKEQEQKEMQKQISFSYENQLEFN